ncbi:Aldehyde dehydrogenase [Seminavis robusta]|uniref:Aldehyde dehydrogenase n=1 Tax=Seminavis robusta TaxID=568900 RepID=A0A9N8HPC0_9STRA|nr:Aldehyde dehydrogenase [Seminavis robusta]|eukprot:Sro1311_g261750.1 Aldehyde dehydrogenase (533) ;mRNA; r:6821-8514
MCKGATYDDKTEPVLPAVVEDSLRRLGENQAKWSGLSVAAKLELLEAMLQILTQEMTLDQEWKALADWTAETLMGLDLDGPEGQAVAVAEAVLPMVTIKAQMEKLIEGYKAALGTSDNMKHYDSKMKPQVHQPSGQVYLPVYPITPKDNFDLLGAGMNVEWWLDPEQVQKVDQAPKPFHMEPFKDNVDEGVLVVLGAGNQSFLTLVDILDGLFVRQRTVFCKHNPLRGAGLDPICRKLFRPLYEQNFLGSCLDLKTLEANSALVYHSDVTAIHMTGGKPTHDAVVWGSTKEEQETNKQNNTPKLQAEMSSELGCITPWIMSFEPNASYTKAELQHHAQILVMGVYSNASSNCLAPKVVVMAEEWPQREEFQKLVQAEWQKLELPVAYYPGCQDRWNRYREKYASAVEWHGAESSKEDRRLSPPLLNNGQHGTEAVVLPLLCVDLKVDLSTKAGRESARNEYAFQHEPFCPVLTFVTLQNNNTTTTYLETAVDLCNNYIFGTLSTSMSVPKSLEKTCGVEMAIANVAVRLRRH